MSKYDQAAETTVAYSLCMTSKSFETNRVRILRVQLYIEEHLDEDLSVERLAAVAHVSPFHFHRIFRANVGEGVAEYVRRIRIEAAAIALKSTSDSVTTIALDAGYGSHEAFTRAFRRRFGVSPLDCRNNHLLNAKEQETKTMSGEITTREVRVETIDPLRVAFLRFVGPYEGCGPTFDRLMGWAGPKGLLGPGTKVLAVCHDDPDVTPADKLRLDCCFTVPEDFEAVEDLQVQTIPAGECVVLTHRGPYTGLKEAYGWLYGEWLSTSGREFANQPPFEIYTNNPSDTPPEELVTEICVSLKPR